MGLFEIALWIVAVILLYTANRTHDKTEYQILYPSSDTAPIQEFNIEFLSGVYYVWEADTNKFITQGASLGQIKQNLADIYKLTPEHFVFNVTEAEMES